MNTLRNWSALVMTLFALTMAAAAQDTTQQISGFVKDANGALVAAAAVTARNIGTGQTRTATTNESGYYVIANIPIGEYEVGAEARGFRKFLQKGVSYVYELPFWRAGQRWYEQAFGGWQLSGVTTLQGGRPLNLTIAGDRAGTTSTNQRPDLIGDWQEGGETRGRWFNTAAFALPALGSFGTLGRNVVIGPGTNNWDASLQKLFRLREGLRLDFRAEIYNAPNHHSYFGVAPQLGAANFGQVTSASDPRTIQLGLKLLF